MADEALTCSQHFGFAVGHFYNDGCSSMWFTYLLIFYKKVLQFDDRIAGGALLLGQVADGIATPIIGYCSDYQFHHPIFKYGLKKIWHLVGTIFVTISFPFIFSPYWGPSTDNSVIRYTYYGTFIVLFQIGWAVVQIAHLAMVPILAANDSHRTTLMTSRNVATVLASMLVYGLLYVILKQNHSEPVIGPSDMFNFQLVAYITTAVGIVMSILFHVLSVDKSYFLLGVRSRSRWSILRSVETYVCAGIYVCSRLFNNLGQTYIPLYLLDTLHLKPTYLAVLPLIMMITGAIGPTVLNKLEAEFGRKVIYFLSAIGGLITCVWIHFGDDQLYSNIEIFGVVGFYGAFGSLMLVSSLSAVNSLIGTQTSTGAFVYGIMSTADKVSGGTSVFVIEFMRHARPNDHYFYKQVLVYVCGSAAIGGIITMFFFKSNNYEILQEVVIEDQAPGVSGNSSNSKDESLQENDPSSKTSKAIQGA